LNVKVIFTTLFVIEVKLFPTLKFFEKRKIVENISFSYLWKIPNFFFNISTRFLDFENQKLLVKQVENFGNLNQKSPGEEL
jgi:hypothetical protein